MFFFPILEQIDKDNRMPGISSKQSYVDAIKSQYFALILTRSSELSKCVLYYKVAPIHYWRVFVFRNIKSYRYEKPLCCSNPNPFVFDRPARPLLLIREKTDPPAPVD